MADCQSCKRWFLLFTWLVLVPLANSQNSKPLLQMQRMRAELESVSNAMSSGNNSYSSGLNGSDAMDVRRYPNSAVCVVVYDDGKYFVEKKEERNGRTKAKSGGGSLTADELQQLRSILDQEDLKKIPMPKAPEIPSDSQTLKEAERLDVEVDRDTAQQQFTFMRERLKTGAPTITGAASGSMSGLDTFLDNEGPYKKTVEPLVKWFDEIGKKTKLKDAAPQYCR